MLSTGLILALAALNTGLLSAVAAVYVPLASMHSPPPHVGWFPTEPVHGDLRGTQYGHTPIYHTYTTASFATWGGGVRPVAIPRLLPTTPQ